jgi:hypothetical protein
METKIKLGVFRRFDPQGEQGSSGAARSLELHNQRKTALHHVFDNASQEVLVADWGQTDDDNPHEFVELFIGLIGSAALQYIAVPAFQLLAKKLAEKLIDEASSELAKWMISKLQPKQNAKEILDFQMTLPDGTMIFVDAPDQNGTITVHFKNGLVETIKYGD